MKSILFADDTNLLLSDSDLMRLISKANAELQKIIIWLKINKLSLNIKKTHYIVFHFRQRRIPENLKVVIDNCEVERVKFTKFLGVILHENLTWANHVSYLANKIHKSIGILKALQPKLPISSLHMLYNTLVYPYLQYCNIAWASQYSTLVERIFILQKRHYALSAKSLGVPIHNNCLNYYIR